MDKRSIADARLEKGYRQEYMAKELGVAISTYNQYETGARGIPANIAEGIAKILDGSMEEFFLPTKFAISKIRDSSKKIQKAS